MSREYGAEGIVAFAFFPRFIVQNVQNLAKLKLNLVKSLLKRYRVEEFFLMTLTGTL